MCELYCAVKAFELVLFSDSQSVPPQVLCWQCVYVLNPVLFLLTLPEHTHASRPRCGVELMAALEFVCGDRGFYRGKTWHHAFTTHFKLGSN